MSNKKIPKFFRQQERNDFLKMKPADYQRKWVTNFLQQFKIENVKKRMLEKGGKKR